MLNTLNAETITFLQNVKKQKKQHGNTPTAESIQLIGKVAQHIKTH